jgi:hypothetical protein
MVRGVALALVAGIMVAGCSVVPARFLGGDQIVMEVANNSPRPVALTVAVPGAKGQVVGAADPAVVPPRVTMKVRFIVPPTGQWAIWANDGELMSDADLKGRRGELPVVMEIQQDGNPTWWCEDDCP